MGKAWLSGIEGRAIVTDYGSDGEVAYYLLEIGSSEPVPCSYDIQHLLRGPDIETIEDPGAPPYPIVYKKLDHAWREERALMLALMAMDAGKPAELRAEAIFQAEGLLADTVTRAAVRNRLLSDPLPETIDTSDVQEGSVVAELFSEALELRPLVEVVRNAWLRAAYEFPTEAERLASACVKHGGFVALIAALNAKDPLRFTAWYRNVTETPLFAHPSAEDLFDVWREEAFDLAQHGAFDTVATAIGVGPLEDGVTSKPGDDEIGRLYELIAELAAQVDAEDPELDQKLNDAWTRLRRLQADEADRFYAAFEASLEMPIDAGKRLRAEANALRRKLEDPTSTDRSAEDTIRS